MTGSFVDVELQVGPDGGALPCSFETLWCARPPDLALPLAPFPFLFLLQTFNRKLIITLFGYNVLQSEVCRICFRAECMYVQTNCTLCTEVAPTCYVSARSYGRVKKEKMKEIRNTSVPWCSESCSFNFLSSGTHPVLRLSSFPVLCHLRLRRTRCSGPTVGVVSTF